MPLGGLPLLLAGVGLWLGLAAAALIVLRVTPASDDETRLGLALLVVLPALGVLAGALGGGLLLRLL